MATTKEREQYTREYADKLEELTRTSKDIPRYVWIGLLSEYYEKCSRVNVREGKDADAIEADEEVVEVHFGDDQSNL